MVHRSRSEEAAQKLMGKEFAGIAITDRYSAYLWVDRERRQLCWAHLDRDFQAMVDRDGASAEVGLALQRESARMFKGVEPTNNLGERELRPAVRMRKLSFGTDSAVGSRFFERIMTVVMTLRRQKRGLLNWRAEAFRLRRPAPSLLPRPP